MKTQGYIYCFSNNIRKGVYKIGMTGREISDRLREANRRMTFSLPGEPQPIFRCEISKRVGDILQCETYIHNKLKEFRVGGEFFRVDISTIKAIFNEKNLEINAMEFCSPFKKRIVEIDPEEYNCDYQTCASRTTGKKYAFNKISSFSACYIVY